jgi:putative MATE family efflux protein
MTDRRQRILHGKLFSTILIITLPVAINNLIISLYNMIDALFISSRGALSLSSVTFIDPIITFFYAFSMGITIATTTIIARKIGEGNLSLVKKNIVQTLLLITIVGAIIAFIGFSFAEKILIFLGATDNIINIATKYFKIQMLIIPLKFIGDLYIGIKRAEGSNTKAMIVNIISIGIKVILTYIFIFKYNYGVTSLAYSTLISLSFIAIIAIFELFIKDSNFKIDFKDLKIDYNILAPLIIISLPLIVEKTSLSFSNVIVGMFTVKYSETVLAAYGLTNKLNTIIFSTATGFGVAIVALVSQNLGNNNVKRVKEAIKLTMCISMSISLILLAILFIFKDKIVLLFTKEDVKFYQHTINAMNVYTISVIPWTIFQLIIGVFQGSGHNLYPLMISIFRLYIFRIPVIYILSHFTNLQEYSIWYSMLYANILTAFFAIVLYYLVRWEKTPKIFKKT